MKAVEVRKLFVDFFKEKGHEFIKSSPLIPFNDATLLFSNAGMNQFKDIFLEKEKPEYKRAANYQKCLRVSGKHNDLEDVGMDTYHHTFFEMLGNWSFGDYYKKEAIVWAWELFTERLKLPKDKLYVTVYYQDDEAFELWETVTDIQKEHIMRFKEKENFWEMGAAGPCGPCSEIHIDLGDEACDKKHIAGHQCGVNGDCGRYIELWNLVFIQYNRNEKGDLEPLANKHVDTGAGLERLVSVMQGKKSNYDTDLFTPIIDAVSKMTGKKYEDENRVPMRVISDHIRTLTFAISDGVIPSNEGRGYVIRRILRRAFRYGKKIGLNQPFLYQLVPVVVGMMGEAYPELVGNQDNIVKMVKMEEERFASTLDKGLDLFEKVLKTVKTDLFPGKEAFTLYDTFGFPLDLTELLCREKGLKVDSDGFKKEMDKQKKMARESKKFRMNLDEIEWKGVKEGKSLFLGYEKTEMPVEILKYALGEEGEIRIVLKETPFYAESGGQAFDTGTLQGKECLIQIKDVQKSGDDIIHTGEIEGKWNPADHFTASVNLERRNKIRKNHTATHLLHKALQMVLGKHVKQSGSLVDDEKLRFDFAHFEKMSAEEIKKAELIVNEEIQKAKALSISVHDIEDAKAMGATALFGEKYKDKVRVVQVPEFSMEFCGGTHVANTGEIGVFKIVSESSVASGIRRIEGMTGMLAFETLAFSYESMNTIAKSLNTEPEEVPGKVADFQKEIKKLKKEGAKAEVSFSKTELKPYDKKNQTAFYLQIIEGVNNPNLLKELYDDIKSREKDFIAVLFGKSQNQVFYVIGSGNDTVSKVKAGEIAKKINEAFGGKGGGKDQMAQGNIPEVDEEKVKEILNSFKGKL
ncbi:MAG TPA: alanine--tRNA ligase [Spirochaetia bacterium]|nr:MAG: alanine--tRNA ligase [Spirochaetes bacterium GWB1_36_13]HCL57236.1 alanine--tRNA ligase [Spirochaetia bacterium]